MNKISTYRLLFLIGGAVSFLLYQIKLGGKADLVLLISCLSSGYALMSWVEDKQSKHDNRIDTAENKLEILENRLNQAEFLEKSIIRLEAKVEMLREKFRE